ncbi:glutamine amidotransferase-related protein [Candidatus Symbiopectobacterium sp. NZEC135]|uniref:glutamine amidotransferase-related protein n=1 Tax=Candidatus Symbiopectobacterium sp. NZEC135 TaxID=2820471 RepID=UPI0022267CE6|nr:gamma-glutamyl-gamma-aminobutyrate hydrolase family protein [Candidatus Symbiopectobacterium sp. NZEC135]MCW2481283.1 gamma-glutamyl-gamma-aminobutyrate hydrolase family protein [Candidatus Symbiopectobacterium sp. NZEC135]
MKTWAHWAIPIHECGFQYHYIDTPITALATFDPLHADVLIVLGGPISANDETGYPFWGQELTIIRQRLAQQRPVLGICLGAQLMARALGARVAPMGGKEIGYGPIQLASTPQAAVLAPLSDVPVLHWHGDRFEIPDSGIRLVGSAVCDNQAFSVGTHVARLTYQRKHCSNLFRTNVSARCPKRWTSPTLGFVISLKTVLAGRFLFSIN